MSTGRRIVFGLLILFFLFLLITNPTGAAAAMSAVFAAIGTFFNALVTFIPLIEAGHDAYARTELARRFRELAAMVPPYAVPDEANAYLARHPTTS